MGEHFPCRGYSGGSAPPPTRIMPGRTRGSPERFVPAADRVRHRQSAIREAERDRAAATAGEKAVLAELRAIGLSPAASTGVLRPVQAREVRGLAKRLVGSTDPLGQVFRKFRWGGGGLPRHEEATRLMHSLRPSVARRGGEAGPAASPGPAPLPPTRLIRA